MLKYSFLEKYIEKYVMKHVFLYCVYQKKAVILRS